MAGRLKTVLILTACFDEPHRTMGSVPKIARQLSKRDRVIVFSGGTSDRVEERSKTLRVYFVKEWLLPDPVNNGFVPSMFSKLQRVLDKEKPDVVLNTKHMFYPNLAVPWLKRRGYRVLTATDAFPGYSWFTTSWFVNTVLWVYARTFGKWVLRSSDKVILFHDGLVSTARKLKLNYTVIPNGVELEVLRAAKPKKLAGKFNVLYVGRLESVKGYKTIVAAMERITTERNDVHCYIVGDTKGKEHYVKEHSSGQIHFEGRKSLQQCYEYMKSSDVILLASKTEGLPNAIMEGMAAGCVPISTPVGAVPSLFEHGKLGVFFPYNNTDKLVTAITWVLEHPKERAAMVKLGQKKILKEYDWSVLGKRYYAALQ